MTYIDEVANYIESTGLRIPTICGTFLCGELPCGYIPIYRNQGPPYPSLIVLTSLGGSPSILADKSYDFPMFSLMIQDSDPVYAHEIVKQAQTELQCTVRVGNIVSIITEPPTYTRITNKNLHQYTMTMTVTMERS